MANILKGIRNIFSYGEKRAAQSLTLNQADNWQSLLLGAGVSVSRDQAMKLSVYFSAVQLIANSLASVPLKCYKTTATGRETLKGDNRYKLLHDSPNDLQTSFSFRHSLAVDVLTTGNCFAIIHRIGSKIAALEYVPYGNVSIEKHEGKVLYKIYEKSYKPADILHVHGMGFDGLRGFSPLDFAGDVIKLGLSAAKWSGDYFDKGTVVSGLLVTDSNLTVDQRKALKEAWYEDATGSKNNHGTKILGSGLKYQKMANTPEESALIDQRKFQIQEVARLFNIPLHMLADLDKSSFNNIEVQGYEYTKYCLTPWCIRFEQEYRKKLFPEEGYFAEHSLDGLLRASSKDRAELYAALFKTGAITPNQIAKLENLEGTPEGDRRYISKDMIPTDLIDKIHLQNDNSTAA